ncbi:MAG: alpha/beta hydrolase [Bacteroidales bacterium]|nr:MAG: alpha/beta hydrolase [Bacteroidales bacterium]
MRLLILGFFMFTYSQKSITQDFIPLWPVDNMPNSRGINVEEVIVNERILQVDIPGIFTFFPSKEENTESAVIICPSGGYHHLTYILGGFQLAKWFNTIGITAFVLKYRLPHSPDLIERDKAPLQDAQRAMRIIRSNAAKWGIQPEKIGIMGTSAGGHLASNLATHPDDVSSIGDSLDKISCQPDFLILISPVISMGKYTHKGSRDNLLGKNPEKEIIEKYSSELHVSTSTPPSFIVHAANDKSVDPLNSLIFYQALTDNNVQGCSLHIFPLGGHSIALKDNPGSVDLWPVICKKWLIEIGIIN